MKIAVIGGGPAGLHAAEVAAAGGAEVTLFDAKASVGRKFLVAGKGGLNLTNAEPHDQFVAQYRAPEAPHAAWDSLLAGFDANALRAWADRLGIATFAASTGRIYPRELKAAPLLRHWVQCLRTLGVRFAMHHRWIGLQPDAPVRLDFDVRGQSCTETADAVLLALGGGSWPVTGSDGAWISILEKLGVTIAPLQPANCGWEVSWPDAVLDWEEGQPLKNVAVRTGATEVRGELLITKYGLEGSALYALSAELRAMAEPRLAIDFKPDVSVAQLLKKAHSVRGQQLSDLRRCWRLSDAMRAVLEINASASASVESLAQLVKHCPLRLTGPRPLAEAISTAGGIRWSELDETLMIRRLPGVFAAGEMLDWEAPTGGYLIQGCFATGERAGRGALAWRR